MLTFSHKSYLAFSLANKTFRCFSKCFVSSKLQMCKGFSSLLLLLFVTRSLLSFENTILSFKCKGFIMVEEYGCESTTIAVKVPCSIYGVQIQETNLRSSMDTHAKTMTKNLRGQELICNYMLFKLGKQGYKHIHLMSHTHTHTHTQQERRQWMRIESKHE